MRVASMTGLVEALGVGLGHTGILGFIGSLSLLSWGGLSEGKCLSGIAASILCLTLALTWLRPRE
jgi:hypothetical protein